MELWKRNVDSDTDGHADCNFDGYPDGNSNGYSNGNFDGHSHTDGYPYRYSDRYSYPDGYANAVVTDLSKRKESVRRNSSEEPPNACTKLVNRYDLTFFDPPVAYIPPVVCLHTSGTTPAPSHRRQNPGWVWLCQRARRRERAPVQQEPSRSFSAACRTVLTVGWGSAGRSRGE